MKEKNDQNRTSQYSKSEKYWALLGQFAAIITIIYGGYELLKPVFFKEYNIDATASFKPYDVPESLYIKIDTYLAKIEKINKLDLQKDSKLVKLKYHTGALLTNLIETMNKFNYNMRDPVIDDIDSINSIIYPKSDSTRSSRFDIEINEFGLRDEVLKLRNDLHYNTYILSVKIFNKSNKELERIKLRIKGRKGYFKVKVNDVENGLPGYAGSVSDFIEDVDIEKISVNEGIDIIVWIDKPTNKESIKLMHSGKEIEMDYIDFQIM